jgi:KH domain-containing protein
METFFFEKTRELRKELKNLQERLNVKMVLTGRKLVIDGDPLNEYEASRVIEAMQFGFSASKSLSLLENDVSFKIIPIKQFTRKKNMHEVRARIIGKEGKTKRALENISNCEIMVKESNELGIICSAQTIDKTLMGITNLIKGTKQSNVYAFLEKMNAYKKELKDEDLGIKKED